MMQLDAASGVPFYRQIIDQVLLAISDGRMLPGTQLPTVRQLAVDLSVNLNTVSKAYRELELRGFLVTQQGTGTFVAKRAVEPDTIARQQALNRLIEEFTAKAAAHGFSKAEVADVFSERSEGSEGRTE